MKKSNMLTIVMMASALVVMPASAKMSKSTKGFIIGALAGSAVTYMINKNGSKNQEDQKTDINRCHNEEVLKKNEYGKYEKVNIQVCDR